MPWPLHCLRPGAHDFPKTFERRRAHSGAPRVLRLKEGVLCWHQAPTSPCERPTARGSPRAPRCAGGRGYAGVGQQVSPPPRPTPFPSPASSTTHHRGAPRMPQLEGWRVTLPDQPPCEPSAAQGAPRARLGAREEGDAGVGQQVHRARQRRRERRPAGAKVVLGARREQRRAAARAAASAQRPHMCSHTCPLLSYTAHGPPE